VTVGQPQDTGVARWFRVCRGSSAPALGVGCQQLNPLLEVAWPPQLEHQHASRHRTQDQPPGRRRDREPHKGDKQDDHHAHRHRPGADHLVAPVDRPLRRNVTDPRDLSAPDHALQVVERRSVLVEAALSDGPARSIHPPKGGRVDLLERERAWQRERLFPAWDRTGGPSRFTAWRCRNPLLSTVLLLGPVLAVFSYPAIVDGNLLELPLRLAVLGGMVWWVQRLHGRLHCEWLEERDARGEDRPDPTATGHWERVYAMQQAATEAENADPDGEIGSPLVERLFTIYLIYLGVAFAVVLLIEALLPT
jgi:hypothetical protein